jgi:hypothetical protein
MTLLFISAHQGALCIRYGALKRELNDFGNFCDPQNRCLLVTTYNDKQGSCSGHAGSYRTQERVWEEEIDGGLGAVLSRRHDGCFSMRGRKERRGRYVQSLLE